jgi:iron-sulfur cluster assembly protein
MALRAAITISDNAATRIAGMIAKRGKPTAGIRIGVRTKGCSGLSYTIEYADELNQFDEVIDAVDKQTGVPFKVMIDPKAILYIVGTEMDYVEEKLKSGFVFTNPNEKGRCGCGESFHV